MFCFFFFFKQKTAYEMRISDWSSDVCSSDLINLGEERYLDIIGAKTAALFAAACRIAAVVAEREEAAETALDAYGRNLGIAFQLVDDAIDYVSDADTMGKDAGDDFREGKVTLPVLLPYARGHDTDPPLWSAAIPARPTPT